MSAVPKPLETQGTSTSRSIRKEMTRKPDGTVVTKTIITETTIGPDGEKKTKVTEEISEGDEAEQLPKSDPKDKKGSRRSPFSNLICCGRKKKAFAAGGDGDKDKKKPQKMKDFIDEVVKFHNKYRKLHGKPGDLKHNKELDVLAQSWAEHMAGTGKLEHSNANYKGEQLGENVATKWSSVGADYTGQEVADQWYGENTKFDFKGDWQQGCGHFTQMVWKGSKEIGIGKAFGKDGRVFVVANYHPAGNVLGKFKDNVFPKK